MLVEAVYEERMLRHELRRILGVVVPETMRGYRDCKRYVFPQSQDEFYLAGWDMAEEKVGKRNTA